LGIPYSWMVRKGDMSSIALKKLLKINGRNASLE
jgi:hypothetical protein